MNEDGKFIAGIGCVWISIVLFVNIVLIAAIALAVKWVLESTGVVGG